MKIRTIQTRAVPESIEINSSTPKKKRRNTSAKWAAAELRVKKILEEKGYLVQRMFGITEQRAKDYAARHGGTAEKM